MELEAAEAGGAGWVGQGVKWQQQLFMEASSQKNDSSLTPFPGLR